MTVFWDHKRIFLHVSQLTSPVLIIILFASNVCDDWRFSGKHTYVLVFPEDNTEESYCPAQYIQCPIFKKSLIFHHCPIWSAVSRILHTESWCHKDPNRICTHLMPEWRRLCWLVTWRIGVPRIPPKCATKQTTSVFGTRHQFPAIVWRDQNTPKIGLT